MRTMQSWARTAYVFPKKVMQKAYHEGPVQAVGWASDVLYERYREWRLGIDTQGYILWNELGHYAACNSYQPIPYAVFEGAMRQLNLRANQDVFLDYGSGKGRAVVLAATYPFRKVIGVELSAALCTTAVENVRRARQKLVCQEVEIVAADALCYEVPSDVTVTFLFNPFQAQILAGVLEQIRKSQARQPRRLTIFYAYPAHTANVLAECDWLEHQQELPSWERLRFAIYRTKEANGPTPSSWPSD